VIVSCSATVRLARLIWRSKRTEQNVVDQRRLPEPETPVIATKSPRRHAHRDVLQVLARAPFTVNFFPSPRRRSAGHGDVTLAPTGTLPVTESLFSNSSL